MKRLLTCLSLSMIICSSLLCNVFADETPTTTQTYTVYYDGSDDLKSDDFDSSTLDTILSSMEPGDSAAIEITLENKSGKSVEWYMKNDSSNFEEENDGLGGIYTYRLTYSGSTNMTLYDSDTVGGEDGNGIEGATEDLNVEFFELDRRAPGEKGVVTMYLKLDGETLDNGYQLKEGTLSAIFELEEIPDPENKVEHHSRIVYIPYTGDSINLNFYIIAEFAALFLLAMVVFAYVVYCKRQERSK